MLKLYHGPTSVCSQKVRVALAEIGLDYESHLLDLQKGDQFDPDYMRLNPEAVVPTLVDDALVLFESSLIAEYLDKTYNDGRFMPEETALEARTRLWLVRSIAVHGAINTLSFSTAMRAKILSTKTPEEVAAAIARMPDPVAREKRRNLFAEGLNSYHVGQALRILRRCFSDMSNQIGAGDWLSGPTFGLADIALVPYIDRVDRLGFSGLWGEDFATVGTWHKRMRQRHSYATAFDAFIPEDAAKAQRDGGIAFWPELSRRWEEMD